MEERLSSRPLSELPRHLSAPKGTISLLADFGSPNGVKLFLVNCSREEVTVPSQDGDFYAKLETRDEGTQKWTRAQPHYDSFCSNSYITWRLEPMSFIENCGYIPRQGQCIGPVRYRIYSKVLSLDLISNTGTGLTDPEDISLASNDMMSIRFGDIEKVKSVLSLDKGCESSCSSQNLTSSGQRSAAIRRLGFLQREDSVPVILCLLEHSDAEELRDLLLAYSQVDREDFITFVLSELKSPERADIQTFLTGLEGAWKQKENQDCRIINELLVILQDSTNSALGPAIHLLDSARNPESDDDDDDRVARFKDREQIEKAFRRISVDSKYPWQIRMNSLGKIKAPEQTNVTQLFAEGLGGFLPTRMCNNAESLNPDEWLRKVHPYFEKNIALLGLAKIDASREGPEKRSFCAIFREDNITNRSQKKWQCVRSVLDKDSVLKVDVVTDTDPPISCIEQLCVFRESFPALDSSLWATMTNLRYLELGFMTEQLQMLGLALKQCPSLESLVIGYCHRSNEDVQAVLKDQAPLLCLTSLTCDNANLAPHILALCPNVRQLSVPFSRGLGPKIASLCPNVTHLFFDQPSLSDEDLDSLLSIPTVVDFGMFCLSQGFISGGEKLSTRNRKLRRLVLGSCSRVSYDGMKKFANLYPSLRHVQVSSEKLQGKETEVKQLFHPACTVELEGFGDSRRKTWNSW